jgi:hypothetical protein
LKRGFKIRSKKRVSSSSSFINSNEFIVAIFIISLSVLAYYPLVDSGAVTYISNHLSGFASTDNTEGDGQVALGIRPLAYNATGYKNRIFYEDGSLINITLVGDGVIKNVSADFSCIDSNFEAGDEIVSMLSDSFAQQNFSISYQISESNSLTNWVNADDSTCPVGEECHRICNITLTSSLGPEYIIPLPFYEGNPSNQEAWYAGYVTRASNCAAGVENSKYFLEYDTCSSVFYNVADLSYYYGAKDVDFAIKKKNTPDVVERHCTNGIDDDGDTKTDCEDSDCASVVYGEYYIVGGSNANKGENPGWVCNKTEAGWRDDPPYGAGDLATVTCVGGGACDDDCASNICTGSAEDTTVTFTRRIAPDANLSIRLEQNSGISTTEIYFKVWQFNSSLWQNGGSDFSILNESGSSGFSPEQGKGQTSTSVIAQSGDFENDPIDSTNSQLDVVLKAIMDTTNSYNGLFGLVLNRIFDGDSSNFKFNINITDDGMTDEHDISCADSYDNDLDYTTDCLDVDCDNYPGSNSANPDGTYPICEYGFESTYAATNNTCMDNFDNDVNGDKDCHYSAGTWDSNCDDVNIINASWDTITNIGGISGICQLGTETTCDDGFDNDRDRAYDCVTEQVESYANIQYSTSPAYPKQSYTGGDASNSANRPDAEYNCRVYCNSNGYPNETGNECYDGKDNDLDYSIGGGMDCRMINYDSDCNQSNNGSFTCELVHETSCEDGFDNDRDGEYDCIVASTGDSETNPVYQFGTSGSNLAHGEYDCQATCNISDNFENTGVKCYDNKDNDLDYWTITSWSGTAYVATNNNYSGGMDCRFNYDGTHYPDANCDGVDMTGEGQLCELGYERNCTDGYDNDRDNSYNYGGNRLTTNGSDCDDYDCAAYCQTTFGQEQGLECLDGIDNELDRYDYNITDYLRDTARTVNVSGGVDCVYYYNNSGTIMRPSALAYAANYNTVNIGRYQYDPSCNNTVVSGENECQLVNEINCSDGFDNDQDYYMRPAASPVGGNIYTAGWNQTVYEAYFGESYSESADCDDYSCSGDNACPIDEANDQCQLTDCPNTKNWCLDGFDNDLDVYLSDGFTANSADGAGIDCAWNDYDSDCNNTFINDSNYTGMCTLRWEFNCSDNVDNDQDLGTYEIDSGLNTGVDCDDYNCFGVQESGNYVCTEDETGDTILETTCNDSIDNDLDAYSWNGTAYELNSSTGVDCSDPDCNMLPGPDGSLCALSEEMGFDPFTDAVCGDYNSSGTTAYSSDNDGDLMANCYDTGCYHQGLCRVCPDEENVTLDSCMDGLNNEYEYQNAVISNLLYADENKNLSLFDNALDCGDSDCDGLVGKYGSNYGVCNYSAAGKIATESICDDGYDNDFDGLVDCEDSNCAGDSYCIYTYTNSITSCAQRCSVASTVVARSSQPPKSSVNSDWGGGSRDLTYTQYQLRGQNLTFHFTDAASNVNGKTLAIYLGSASATYIPLEYKLTQANSGIYGDNSESFNLQYSAQSGSYYQAILIEYDGAYPNEDLDLTFWVELPDEQGIVDNSSYSFYISTALAGSEKSSDVTQYIIETELPQAPTFVKTVANDNYTTSGLRKIKSDNTVARTTQSDTILIKVNASDDSGTWNSGIEYCEFNNGSGWVTDGDSDCSYYMTLSEGVSTIYARAVDEVGNVGPNSSVDVNVTTLPIPTSVFYCDTEFAPGCSVAYPTKDYYADNETMNVAIDFSSPNGFTQSGTGCTVYAETQNAASRISLGTIALDSDGTCSGNVSLSVLSDQYYAIKVETSDTLGSTIRSGEKPWDSTPSKENIWVCDYMQTFDGYTCKDQCESISGDTPDQVILKSPSDGNTTNNRTPGFEWYNADAGQTPLYEIQIDDSNIFASIDYAVNGIAEQTTITTHNISQTLDVDTTYFWRVRAYSGFVTGVWSEPWNFTVESLISITFLNSSVDFGANLYAPMSVSTPINGTPFLLENTGNLPVNLSVNATNLWDTHANPSDYYQFKIRVNESEAFDVGESVLTFTNMPLTGLFSVWNFEWVDANDALYIDINLTVPYGEHAGQKNSTVLVSTI